jgi:hypothetical protein
MFSQFIFLSLIFHVLCFHLELGMPLSWLVHILWEFFCFGCFRARDTQPLKPRKHGSYYDLQNELVIRCWKFLFKGYK